MYISGTVAALVGLLTLVPTHVAAHSWIEEFQLISANGSYVGDRGYARGYVGRTDHGYNGDSMNYLLPSAGPRLSTTDLLCHPAQRTSNYTNPAYPQLKATPGSYVAMKYTENGHVTLPWVAAGKPDSGGTVYVFGTTQPSTTEKITDVLQWTADGKGGDGRGFLMSTQDFDDGRCHQINSCDISAQRQVLFPLKVPGQPGSSPQEQWCESDIQIPSTQAPGTLTVYWIWQYQTAPMTDCNYPTGMDEYWTTCSDIQVETPGTNLKKLAAQGPAHTLMQENPQTTAVINWASRSAQTPSPAMYFLKGASTITHRAAIAAAAAAATPAPNATWTSSCASIASAAASMAKAGIQPSPPPACPAGKWATGALYASISSSVLAAQSSPAVSPSPTVAPTAPTSAAGASSDDSTTTTTTLIPVTPTVTPTGLQFPTLSTIAAYTSAPTSDPAPATPSIEPNGIVDSGSKKRFMGRHHARQFA